MSGEAVFQRACAACHGSAVQDAKPAGSASGAPPPGPLYARELLLQLTPETILDSITNGKMEVPGSNLSEAERRAVAEFASGRRLSASSAATSGAGRVNACTRAEPLADPIHGRGWNGWGNGIANTRFQPQERGGLTAADLPRLKLKWAFGYANVSIVAAQPAVAGGRLFAASQSGDVYALSAKAGCTYWTFKAQATVRTALAIGSYKSASGESRYAVYFGDTEANAYAVDAETGRQIWVRQVDDHIAAAMTGALAVHDGRVFVPVQGLKEEAQGPQNDYTCCTFRGSLVALNADTGEVIWKTYTVEESRLRGKGKDGAEIYGPAGGGIWTAPTIDVKRGLVYVATGNGYADPPQPTTDAIIAMDIATGAIKWVQQATPNDSWNVGCMQNPDHPACPMPLGPDFDFSASPALTSAGGRDLLVVPQKSGVAFALDPDQKGKIVWQYRFGQGGPKGAVWGTAIDGAQAYFGVADGLTPNPGGMRAVKLADGQAVWQMPPQPTLCGNAPGCSAGQGGALTAIPGAVLSGGLDGGVRAYSTSDGSILWMFDTNREFETVNGVKARGGSIDGPGPIVADGMLYVNSGYGSLGEMPGNVLLAFGLESPNGRDAKSP